MQGKKTLESSGKGNIGWGAGFNVTFERIKKFVDLKHKLALFKLRMANQMVSEPLGMVKTVHIQVGGVEFETTFLVLDVRMLMTCCWDDHGLEQVVRFMIVV